MSPSERYQPITRLGRRLENIASSLDYWTGHETFLTHKQMWLGMATGALVGAAYIAACNGYQIDPVRTINRLIEKSGFSGIINWRYSDTEWFSAKSDGKTVIRWSRTLISVPVSDLARALTQDRFTDPEGNPVSLLSQTTFDNISRLLKELENIEDKRDKLTGLFQLATIGSILYALHQKGEKKVQISTILPKIADAVRDLTRFLEERGK